MESHHLPYVITGGLLQITFFAGYKLLRKPKTYWILFIISILISIWGYLNIDKPSLQMGNGNAAHWTFIPLLFLIYFKVLRQLFLKLFDNEPLLSGYKKYSWEQGEYRLLHFGDVIFTISLVLLPFFTTFIF